MTKKFKHKVVLAAILVLPLLSTQAFAADKAAEKKSAATQPAKPADIGTNIITQNFVQKGILSCAARINQVTSFLGGNNQIGAFIYLPPGQPDQHIASTSMEIPGANKSTAYASASFAPNQTDGCNAVYDAVTWSPKKCEEVAKTQYPGKKITGKLKQNISVIDIDNYSKAFLMPTSDGCVAIKKEVVF